MKLVSEDHKMYDRIAPDVVDHIVTIDTKEGQSFKNYLFRSFRGDLWELILDYGSTYLSVQVTISTDAIASLELEE